MCNGEKGKDEQLNGIELDPVRNLWWLLGLETAGCFEIFGERKAHILRIWSMLSEGGRRPP